MNLFEAVVTIVSLINPNLPGIELRNADGRTFSAREICEKTLSEMEFRAESAMILMSLYRGQDYWMRVECLPIGKPA